MLLGYMSLLFNFNIEDKFNGGAYTPATTQMSLILNTHLKK